MISLLHSSLCCFLSLSSWGLVIIDLLSFSLHPRCLHSYLFRSPCLYLDYTHPCHPHLHCLHPLQLIFIPTVLFTFVLDLLILVVIILAVITVFAVFIFIICILISFILIILIFKRRVSSGEGRAEKVEQQGSGGEGQAKRIRQKFLRGEGCKGLNEEKARGKGAKN